MSRTYKLRKQQWIVKDEIVSEAEYYSLFRCSTKFNSFHDYKVDYSTYVDLIKVKCRTGKIHCIRSHAPGWFINLYNRSERMACRNQTAKQMRLTDYTDFNVIVTIHKRTADWDWD